MQNEEYKDTEIEQTEEDDKSSVVGFPFSPNQVNIITQNDSVQLLIHKLEDKEINLNTEFQRNFVWSEEKQSRLIESILLKLPLPAFYFDEKEDNKWDVVDGLQRCSTLKNFIIDDALVLKGLEFLTELNREKHSGLSKDLQRRIQRAPIVYYLIQKGTPPAVKYNLFKRINIGGEVLTPQEIRHALNQGIPADYVKELAELPEFTKATANKISTKRMQDRDFVMRFITFYLKDYKSYQPDLDSFMNEAMASIKKLSPEERGALKKDFIRAMECSYEIFGDDAFRKRIKKEDTRYPINKAIFEALSVGLAKQPLFAIETLIKKKEIFKDNFIALNNTPAFWGAISTSTGQKTSVEIRFKEIERIINETIEQHD